MNSLNKVETIFWSRKLFISSIMFLLLGVAGNSTAINAQKYIWEKVGVGNCSRHDVGSSDGSTPDDNQAREGYTAVCWDGATYKNGRVFCTYKNLPPNECTGGGSGYNGIMYRAVLDSDDYALVPLKLYFSTPRRDNFSTATEIGERSAINSEYFFAGIEGYVFATQHAGMVPLKLYWNAEREDNFTTATSQGEGAAQAAGYQYIRVEGYIYPTQQPGTVPLKNYWSAAFGDNYSTATAQGERNAINSGYVFAWVEGYVLPAPRGGTPTPTPTPIVTPMPTSTPTGEPGCDSINGHWFGWSGDNSGANFFINPPNFPVDSPKIWAIGGREVVPSDPSHWDRWGEYVCIGTNRFKLVNRGNGIFNILTLRDGKLYQDDGRYACLNNANCQ